MSEPVNIQVTFSFPSAEKAAAAIGLFARAFDWPATIKDDAGQDIPNPVTAQQYSADRLKEVVRGYVEGQAKREAAQTAQAMVATALDGIKVTLGE